MECMSLLSMAANKTAHERHSANLIKHGQGQHEVMSADRAAVSLVLLRRKKTEEGDSSQLCLISY